jgi:hypothetical protein
MTKLFALLLSVLTFTSCQQHPVSASIVSISPNSKTQININAKKQSPLDPLTVSMEVKSGGNSEGSLQFEVTAATLDSSNVKFNWEDSQNCTITFIHSDGEKRIFRYYATANNIILQEIKKD